MDKSPLAAGRKYTAQRSLGDIRDYSYVSIWESEVALLPTSVDLRAQCPPVYDQGQIGSCTANGWAALAQFVWMKAKASDVATPSRRFIYHKEMYYEGDLTGDNGAQVRTGGKVIANVGWLDESLYPYSANIQDFLDQVPNSIFAKAWFNKDANYYAINGLAQMQACLAEGFPFVFGFTVYESFESEAVAQTGIVPMPKPSEQVLGGHCVMAVGYDTTKQQFIVRNSWGAEWGDKGYCYMPFQYLTNSQLASDFYTLRTRS